MFVYLWEMIGDWWMFITIHLRKNHGILGSMDEIGREWPSPRPTLSSQGCSVRSLLPYALRGWDAAPMMPNKKDVRLEVMAWWRCPVVRFEMAFQLRKLQEYPKISKLPDPNAYRAHSFSRDLWHDAAAPVSFQFRNRHRPGRGSEMDRFDRSWIRALGSGILLTVVTC